MTSSSTQLERSVIEQLLRSTAEGGPSDRETVEAVEYDWRVPYRFVPAELKKLGEFAERVAQQISQGLGGLLRMELQLEAAPLKQSYAVELPKLLSEAKDYCIPLVVESGRPCGLILLPMATALSWVGRLLGTSGEDVDADRQLSAIERGLLSDIVAAVANAISAASQQADGPGFRHLEVLPQGKPDLPGEDFSEYCELSVRPSGSPDDRLVSVVILSDILAGICQDQTAKKAERRADDVRKDILAHLQNATVVATARLGRSDVSMRDILSLEPGDVLLMQGRVDEPIDLVVAGAILLSGFPAKSSGKYAVKIAPADRGSTRQAAPAQRRG